MAHACYPSILEGWGGRKTWAPEVQDQPSQHSETLNLQKNFKIGWAQLLTPVISALCEAEVGGSQYREFKTSLTNMVKPHLY